MSTTRVPVLFLGHGSPMNTLEDNRFTRAWRDIGRVLPRPAAILAVSAHWYVPELAVTAMEMPRTIHDFGGFPQALFDFEYPAAGSAALAARVAEAQLSVPTAEHYLPLLPILGALRDDDEIGFPVGGIHMGSLSMLAVVAGQPGARPDPDRSL